MLVNLLTYDVKLNNNAQRRTKKGENCPLKSSCPKDIFTSNNKISFSGNYQPLFFEDIAKLIKKCDCKAIEDLSDLDMISPELKSLLHISTEEKQVKISKILLDKGLGAKVNQKDSYGKTPFNIACTKQDEATVNLLLNYKPDVNTRDALGNTPLHNAISAPQILELLLDKGANPHLRNSFGIPILHKAIDYPDSLSYLLKKGINPNSINDEEQTLLHIASIDGNQKLADLLLDYKAEKNFKDKKGKSPVFYSKDSEMVKYWIKKGIDPNVQDKEGRTALFDFVERNDPRSIIELGNGGARFNTPDNNDKTAILYASNNAIRELLLMCGADPNVKMDNGKTLLHLAVQNNNEKVVETLLKYKANVKILDKEKKPPLFYAESNKIRDLLLTNGANPNDELYLHWALKTGNNELFNSLLKTEVNANIEDLSGRTPIFYCQKTEDIVKLVQKNADINYKDKDGNTPLHKYFAAGNGKIADKLKELGAKTNIRNNNGETPYDLADKYQKYSSWIK
jgi:ankyrin repeat protein